MYIKITILKIGIILHFKKLAKVGKINRSRYSLNNRYIGYEWSLRRIFVDPLQSIRNQLRRRTVPRKGRSATTANRQPPAKCATWICRRGASARRRTNTASTNPLRASSSSWTRYTSTWWPRSQQFKSASILPSDFRMEARILQRHEEPAQHHACRPPGAHQGRGTRQQVGHGVGFVLGWKSRRRWEHGCDSVHPAPRLPWILFPFHKHARIPQPPRGCFLREA